MRNWFLLLFCIGITCSQGVLGSPKQEPENEPVKKGAFPYMGFIYYMDTSVVDATGARFMRSAVLIHPEWLVTSALGPSVIDNGFPEKTLLARVGAVSVDLNFTLNEDEDEQEREVIQIVRPYNHSATQWWTTDISLMKTLFPFKMTSSVGVKDIRNKRTPEIWKTCTILAYTMNSNDTKVLVPMYVDIVPSADSDSCGNLFSADTMVCGVDNATNDIPHNDTTFCRGNSGGPLIHEGDVIGLQTYINNNCRPPYLYQRFTPWDIFITCSIEDKCQGEICNNTCDVTYKDPPKTDTTVETTITTALMTILLPESTTTSIATAKQEETSIQEEPATSPPFSTLLMRVEETQPPVTTTETVTEASSTVTGSTLTDFDIEVMTRVYNDSWPITEEKTFWEQDEKPRRVRVLVKQPGNASNVRAICLMQTLVLQLVWLFIIN